MKPVVACLHTAASNAAIFDAACPAGLALRHVVAPDLLAEAERDGRVTDALTERVYATLDALRRDAAAVLLTCSTLGPVVARLASDGAPVLRADAALADAVRHIAGRVVVLCAAPTSRGPTRALFDDRSGCVTVQLVPAAWTLFRAGDLPAYHATIAQAADAAFCAGADAVALAQVSMTGAAALCRCGAPLTVPDASLRQIERMLT